MFNTAQDALSYWGIRLLPDGEAKKGNVIDGRGVMVWGNGQAQYDGEWSYGLPHGSGQYIDSFGNSYFGEFKLGFFWGHGKLRSNFYQFEYEGDFLLSKRHGKGEMIYQNGIRYTGDWFADLMQGHGVYSMGANYVYQGQMAENQFDGKGKLTTPEGIIEGNFRNGKPHGQCTQTSTVSGNVLKGKWINGKKEGEFDLTTPLGERKVYYRSDVEVFPDGTPK